MSEITRKDKSRACILGCPIDLVDMRESLEFAESRIKSAIGGQIITLNPEMIMQSLKNPDLKEVMLNTELILPDGIGIIIALKKLNITSVKQVPGIEFSYNLIGKCVENNYKIGFLGASKEVIDQMVQELKSKYPSINIVFTKDGYFGIEEESDILDELKNSKPQVLFVALGVPRQELWISKYKNILASTLMVGVGGSFDVWAGKVKRAPVIFRKFGCEWLFRLISQPSRFNRMFPTLPLFFIKVWLDRENTREEY